MPDSAKRDRPHIVFSGHGKREDFTSPLTGRDNTLITNRNRHSHAQKLKRDINRALEKAQAQRQGRDPELSSGQPGFYLEFEFPKSQIGAVKGLEDGRGKSPIELVAVRPARNDQTKSIVATVYVPEERQNYHFKKVVAYETETTKTSGRPKNEKLVASIDAVRLGTLRSLFTDPAPFPNKGREFWWEVWLRAGTRANFEKTAAGLEIVVRDHIIKFAERDVALVRTTRGQLTRLIAHTDAVAEVRLSRDTPSQFSAMEPDQQVKWAKDLRHRLVSPPEDGPAVCILDSGCTRSHPLIEPALAAADHQAWRVGWSPDDKRREWRGHGTAMGGLALYGDLTPVLTSADPVILAHRLESVKILPDTGANEQELYGHITASAVARAEIQAPNRKRVFCMAVTTDEDPWRGRPSSWSAKVDDVAYGEGTDQRLILISAGNVMGFVAASDYLNLNDTSCVESPAQAWNALTVGAVTERLNITDLTFKGWQALAPAGDLSPRSRTSITFGDSWPIKPDVVFEGGNSGVDPATGTVDHVDDLALLTTFHRPNERLLTVTGDTSAATALVARMGAQILAARQTAWSETVRGLIVHSARWTNAMLGHFPRQLKESHKRTLVRRYGYGVPDLERALLSAANDVTLIAERHMQPFRIDGSQTKTRDMILHEFPWPQVELEALGETVVRMRVTLSYFIEPNPGERGWVQKHTYASHGLRFKVKLPGERIDDFRRRINKAAQEEEEAGWARGQDTEWFLGEKLRNKGSVHSDVWTGTAADLARRHAIAVFPTGGWWRYKKYLERADRTIRYSLIVSLETSVDVDLYTPILTQISPEVDVDIDTW